MAKTFHVGTLGILALLGAGPSSAQGSASPMLAKQLAPSRTGDRLVVTSDAFLSGHALDERFTQNGENRSPPIAWNKGPSGTQSYAILVEDPDVKRPDPVTHWVVYDIPSTQTRLGENQPVEAEFNSGAMQGLNVQNTVGFVGPKPPAGETHPYHFQVFALNKRLKLDPKDTDRDDVVKAMKGHVLASGDLVGTYTGK